MSTDDVKYKKELASELGEIIRKLNPYTNKRNKDTGQLTGEMELYVNGTRQTFLPTGSNTNIGLEMEGPYRQEWTFKGQPQKVGMAARIKYRYPVQNEKEVLFWVEDYLLIGFQGSMGG